MRRTFGLYGMVAFLSLSIAGSPTLAVAGQGDCGQPVSVGLHVTAGDCLFILKAAIGTEVCDPPCICNVDGSGSTSATDALLCLKIAVGQPGVALDCMPKPCPHITTTTTTTLAPLPPCSSADVRIGPESNLDMGWNGYVYDADLAAGATIGVRIVKRCSDDASVCKKDADCASGTCELTCDCDEPGNDLCELTGPSGQSRCLVSLAPCKTDADCPSGESCEHFAGPPLPIDAAGVQVCFTSYFDQDVSGTIDLGTGEATVSTVLRSRVHLKVPFGLACPTCGRLDQNPEVGDVFTCGGGPNDGAACTVDAVSATFGGVSYGCPPDRSANVAGLGLPMRLDELTTGVTSRTAVLPCQPPLNFHPANGNGFCLNHGDTSCTSNADCAAFGGTCGLYCHCGYCDGDVDLPCFSDAQCPEGTSCEAGVPDTTALPQDRPNPCSTLVCGAEQGPERCDSGTPSVGRCSLLRYRDCMRNSDCSAVEAGDCIVSPRPCFENTITRQGISSSLGRHCVDNPVIGPCAANADCGVGDCEDDTAAPTAVALFCVPPPTSAGVSYALGLTGPAALELESVVRMCRCGDGVIGCDEDCEVGDDSACPAACDLENCLCD
jgi:Cys-rich repeat protein